MAEQLEKAAVIGWPVKHSLSPAIHAFWRQQYGIKGAYRRIACAPEKPDFEACVRKLIALGYRGVNVTIPHKFNAFEMADDHSETASLLGAANMLSFEGDRIYADNSDVHGFKQMMADLTPDSDLGARALVLGAGGAAPAICLGLRELGVKEIFVANRTEAKARDLAEKYGFVDNFCSWPDLTEVIETVDILVNTTPLGMPGQAPLEIDLSGARTNLLVADIVYNPLETSLIQQARACGLKAANGLAMLMHQAVPGFETWFGHRAEVSPALSDYLVGKLDSKASAPVKIGLTGSIGMGKSTAADVLAEQGAAVWDADSAVHRLYAAGGAAVGPVGEAFPDAIENGAVSREKLAAHLTAHPDDFKKLEAIVHPLVAADRQAFHDKAVREGISAVVMDIPLLFETGQSQDFDELIVVTADLDVRRERVLARPGMTEEKFASIVARQVPEDEKTMLADYVVHTDRPLEETAAVLARIYREILENYA